MYVILIFKTRIIVYNIKRSLASSYTHSYMRNFLRAVWESEHALPGVLVKTFTAHLSLLVCAIEK